MTDLSEYAKRAAASNHYPGSPGTWTFDTWERGIKAGILHLAARIVEDDVIEAGAQGWFSYNFVGSSWDDAIQVRRDMSRKVAREVINAMLAKIAETYDDSTSEKGTP